MPPATPLTQESIAVAALRIVDERGYGALTVRALADELGVRAASLYHHVSGRDEILVGVTDLLGRRIDLSALSESDAGDALAGVMRSYREAFAEHPEVSFVLAQAPSRPGAMAIYEAVISTLVRLGVPREEAHAAVTAAEQLVIGHVVLAHRTVMVDAGEEGPDGDGDAAGSGAAVRLTEILGQDDEGFEWGLGLICERVRAVARES